MRKVLTGFMVLFHLSIALADERECRRAQVELLVLGSGGPELDDGRASSGYLVLRGGDAVALVDAGAGTAMNFERAGARFETLQAILLSHLHVDHSADLPAYVKGSFFTARERDLRVIGPAGNRLMPATSDFVRGMFGENGVYPYLGDHLDGPESTSYQLLPADVVLQRGSIQRFELAPGLAASAVPVHHGPVAAVAWRVDIAGCAIAFSGDMSNDYGDLPRLARDVDLLVLHNAIPEGAQGVADRLHMHPSEMGRIAAAAGARRVLVSHRMKRTLGVEAQTAAQIRKHYAGPLRFADDLTRVDFDDTP